MKTHEIAKVLTALARALKEGPNVELSDVEVNPKKRRKADSENVPVALTTLVAFSQFDKSQWQALISSYGFPVEVRPRDASRDILGKILKHLEENPDARQRLATEAALAPTDASPELMRAMRLLLRG